MLYSGGQELYHLRKGFILGGYSFIIGGIFVFIL